MAIFKHLQFNLERTYDQVNFQIGSLAFFIEQTGYKPKNGFIEIWRESVGTPTQYFVFGKRIWWEMQPRNAQFCI